MEPWRLSDHFRVLFYSNGEEMSSMAIEPRSVDISCNFGDRGWLVCTPLQLPAGLGGQAVYLVPGLLVHRFEF